jgi:hypothetical protein
MKSIFRNILAVVAGLLIGGAVNMSIIMISGTIIPPPHGADVTTVEGLKAAMHLFEPKHFIMPFLAHALGTFVGAIIAALIATNHKMRLALIIGMCFLVGGSIDVAILPAPLWFNVLDLVGAYIPMAYFAGKIIELKQRNT